MTTLASILDMHFSLSFCRHRGLRGADNALPAPPTYVLCQSYARNANLILVLESARNEKTIEISPGSGDFLVLPHGQAFQTRNNVSQPSFPL